MLRWLLAPLLAGALMPVTGVASSIDAQETLQVRIDAVDTTAYPRLRAAVTVLDGSGRPIVGLSGSAFSADVDGEPLPVMGVTTALDANVPAAVVLAFDTSGSMQGAAIEQARQGGKALVNQLGPNDQVAIITFSNTVQVVQGFTNDRGALAAAIDGIAASGNTALYDGVVAGVNTTQPGAQRRAVVLLSDGKDSGGVSASDRNSSLAAAQTAGVPFFVVGLGEIDQQYLQELVNVTRGQLFISPSPEALSGLYETIGSALRNQYLVDLDGSSLDPATATSLTARVNYGGSVVTATIPLDLSAFAPAPTPVASPAPATPVATPVSATEEEGGSSLLLPAVAAIALVAALSGGGFTWLRRRRRGAEVLAAEEEATFERPAGAGPRSGSSTAGPVFVGTAPAAQVAGDAWLEVIAPQFGERYAIGEEPVTVGFTGDCTICLPNGSNQRWERFRIWRREGRYMLHNLSRFGGATVAGKPAPWAVLEDGDEIQMGEWRLVFRTAGREVNA